MKALIRDPLLRGLIAKRILEARSRSQEIMQSFTAKERRYYVQDFYSGILTGIDVSWEKNNIPEGGAK